MATHDGTGADPHTSPRILCVADERPWPERSGYRIRLANVLRALGRVGTVDLLVLHGEHGDPSADLSVPRGEPVRVVRAAPLPAPVRARVGLLSWLRGDLPRRIAWRDWSMARVALDGALAQGYDLVWWSHLDTWVALGERSDVPAVVDLDNLEHEWLDGRRAVRRSAGRSGRVRSLVADQLDAIDARRWRRLQDRAATDAAAVIVCTESDRSTVGGPRVHVVPNGYAAPAAPVGHPERPVPPDGGVIAFVGLQTYEPNADGARFLVEEILPAIRAQRPAVAVHLIGRAGPAVERLAGPGVRVLGEVEDLAAALVGADLVAVPIRFGGGTRIKVLEAMAHHIPVVATSLGCSGLDLHDGVEVVIADDATSFAAACVRMLAEPDLRVACTAAAAGAHAARYEWAAIVDGIVAVTRSVLAVPA